MNWEKSTQILELNDVPISELNMKIIKRKFHKLSLLHHPDKNNNTEKAKIKFQEINEAYSYLNEIYYYENDDDDNNNNNNNNNNNEALYEPKTFSFPYFLKIFIQSLFDKKYSDAIYNVVYDILYNYNYKTISIKIFDGIEKEYCLMIYMFLMKYKNLLHLNQEIVDEIREIILKKYDNVYCYKLNPKINDLFENNVYKLNVNDEMYIVPLWHNELHFTSSTNNNEIIVLCNPSLPNNICIDENNNILIDHEIDIYNVIELLKHNSHIEIELDNNRKINIDLSKLCIRQKQKYILRGEGISIIKDDIYDIEEKSDIIITITLIMD